MTLGPRSSSSLLMLAFLVSSACSRKSARDDKPPQDLPSVTSPSKGSPEARPIVHIEGSELLEKIASSGAKGTIVNAWASWCGPCRREFPMLVALQDNLTSRGIEIVFVSVDEADGEPIALEFAKERGVSPPIFVAERPLGPFKHALNPKWPGMLPATFLYDESGKLRYFWGGPVYENELLPVIEGFLAGEAIDGQAEFGLSPGKDFRHE